MTIIEDTRNKEGKHNNVKAYCERYEIELVRKKLDVGDYMLPDGKVSIDTKENLSELATNLMNRTDRSRFWREVRRAREHGIKLIVLCEHGEGIRTLPDVAKWRSKFSPVSGRALIDEMFRVQMAYGVEWQFCEKKDTGREIVRILSGGNLG